MASANEEMPPDRYLEFEHQQNAVTNICELNEDCLLAITENLSLSNLYNLAQMNRLLNGVVKRTVCSRFNLQRFKYIYVDNIVKFDDNISKQFDDRLHISHRLLEMGGDSIKKLHFDIRNQNTIENLLRHCSNLTELTVEGNYIDSFDSKEFCVPLKELKKLYIRRSNLGKNILQLYSWCRHINTLEFDCIYSFADRNCLNYHFPCLEHFIMKILKTFDINDLKPFIELNSQLKTLDIGWPDIDRTFFDYMNDKFQSLETLKLRLRPNFSYDNQANKKMLNVQNVELRSCNKLHSVLSFASHQFPAMKSLIIRLIWDSRVNDIVDIDSDPATPIEIMTNLESIRIEFIEIGSLDDRFDLLKAIEPFMQKLSKIDLKVCEINDIYVFLKFFEYFPNLNSLVATCEVKGNVRGFDVDFHKAFNRIVSNRTHANISIRLQPEPNITFYEVDKDIIQRDGQVICRKRRALSSK